MSVERETVEQPEHRATAFVARVTRQKNGRWSIEVAIDIDLRIDGGRRIRHARTVSIAGVQQVGRKR